MKKVGEIWLVVLFSFCLTLMANTAFAEPPKRDRCQWTEANAVFMAEEGFRAKIPYDGEEITVPDVWFGGWSSSEDKYQLAFYAEGVHPEYQILFGLNDWSYASLVDPQKEQTLANTADYETVPFPYVQTGVYIPGPGVYNMEVRVYVGNWYFLFKESVTVPPFEVWMSNACLDVDSVVKMTFVAYPLFALEFKEGEIVTVKIGENLFFETTVSSVNEWGEAKFEIAIDAGVYGDLVDDYTSTVFGLSSGQTYSRDIYYWEAADGCGKEEKLPVPKGNSIPSPLAR